MTLMERLKVNRYWDLPDELGRPFTIPGTVIPERIRRVMLARLDGSMSPWMRRALTGTLPTGIVGGSPC